MSIYLLDSEQKQKEYLGLLGQAIGDPDFYKGTIKIDDVQATKLVGKNEYKQEGTVLQDIGQGAVQGTLGFKDAVFLGLPATIAQGLSTYYSLTGDEEKAKEQRGVASELGKMAKENAETRRALRDYKGGGFAEDFGAGVASTLIFGATGAISSPIGYLTVLGQSIGQRTIEGQQEGELTQEQTNKELAVNVGFGSFEGMLDLFSANKLFSGAFKKQIKKSAGGIKSYGKAFLKSGFEGAVTEAVTEGSQSAIHDIGDIVLGRLEDNEIFNRAMKSFGLGFVVGGTIGGVAGTVGRARAYDETLNVVNEQLQDTIPDNEKRIIANTIVDNSIQNVADIARTQVQYSESIRNEYGALWNNLYNSVYKAYNEVGALSNLSEEERATMIREATAQQATIALEESIRRKVPLKDIFGGKEIKYLGNGKIGLEEITEEQPAQQIESLETVKPETLENVREAGESEEYVRIADKKLPVSYEIVEASDLITSNDSTGKVNEEYPAELQNRDRSRPELVKQVENISENIQPEKVGKNVVAGVGAPIVLRNNVVAIGNGRTNGIKLAYSKDKAESYKQYLKEQGFNIDNFDNPVLVRRVKEEYTPEQLRTIIEEGNTSDTYTFSISEESLNDAQKLSSDLFESYNAEAELDSRENIDFVNKIFNAIVPQAEKGKYIDNSGIITPAGIRRIKNAMLGYLLPNNRLLSSVLETEDEVIKKTSNALLNSASKIVDFEEQIKNGTVEKEYSIIDDIRSAFELYVGAKRSKQDVNVYINNMDMFRKPSDISISLANLFLKSRSAKAVSDVIDSYVLSAQEEGRANQLSLGLTEKQSKEDILNNLLDRDKLYQETIEEQEYTGETININGVERTVYNSLGERIGKTEQALRNFWNWFGDSKVVDKQGRPLVVYHGTNYEFYIFKGTKILNSSEGVGFNFAVKKDIAEGFGKVMTVYLKLENPVYAYSNIDLISDTYEYDFEIENQEAIRNAVYKVKENLEQKGYTFYNEVDSDMLDVYAESSQAQEVLDGLLDLGSYIQEDYDAETLYNDIRQAEIDAFGIDGYVTNNYGTTGGKVYVAFEPNQIKSTSNRGTYSLDEDNIYYQSAFHGSPNKELEGGKFDLKYAGKTTGNVHGHGVYAVVSKPSAEYWAGKNGQVYELDVPEDFELIDEQKGFDEQTEKVRYAILGALEKINGFGLLEKAVLDNMPGGEIYVALGKDVFFDKHGYEGGSTEIMKAASEFLDKLGIKGITYDYANEKNFVIFNPADVKVIQKFYQETGTKKPVKKGYYNRNSKIIKFLKSADESTIPHEFAHYWLDSISSFASSGMASNEYMARFKQITDYLGNPVNGKFNRKQSETFAGAYEKYLATGKAPNSFPLLAVVFDNYKRWIQNVYDSAEDVTISGTNEKPVLNENIISVFDSLLGNDLDISRYAEYMGSKETEKIENKFEEKATPEIERITSPETTEAEIKEDTFEANNIDALIDNTELSPLKPVESTGKVKEGKVSRREIFAEPTMYNVASNEQQIELARKEVIKDPEKVEQMIKGEKGDKNVLTTALYIALGEHYKKTGQTDKLNNLIQEYSERSIRLGQEVQAQIMAKNTPEIFWNASMQKQLLDVLASKNADKLYIDSGTNATDTLMKQINNEVSDFVDSIRNVKDLKEINNKLKDFIKKEKEAYQGLKQADVNPVLFQQDVFDIDGDIKQSELTALVKNRVLKAIGVLLDGEELEKLNTLIRNLDNEYLSNAVFNSNGEPIGWNTTFGNPTPEWFAKRNALQDYVKSKNPSNAIELLTKGVIRASLLSSIKSQTTNIVSNTANWFAERTSKYISNTLLGLTNENNVNKGLIREAKKDILRTFNIGKVDITMAKDILDDFNLKGEEVVNFAGKGKFWDYAGIYSDFILRKLLGVEDMLFRGYTFVDYMGNYITQKADGRKFKSTNERQNWIDRTFKDAMNINPETAEGKAVRENALADSLFITFQHSSNIASMSLKLREALEKVLDNMGLKGMTYSIMPFVKTPANVIDMNYRYLAGSLAPKNLKTLKRYIDLRRKGDGRALYKFSHSKEGREWANAIARNGVGLAVGIAIAGALGFDFEKYNPSYTSETRGERQLTKQTNRAYNAFDILGGSVSLDYLGALGLPAKTELALASEVKQNALKVVIDAFFDTPGISQFSNIVQGLRDLASGDFEEKKVKSKDWAYNAIIEKYPLLSESGILSYILLNTIETLEMGIPAVGKDLLTSIQNEEGIKDALIRQAFGARVKAIKEDEVSNELRRLLKKGNEVTLSSIVNYKNVKSMPDEDKKEVVKLFEEERNKRIEKLMKEPRYKRMTDTERKQEIENINRKLINEISKKPKIFLRQKKMLQNRNKYNTL